MLFNKARKRGKKVNTMQTSFACQAADNCNYELFKNNEEKLKETSTLEIN